MRTLIFLSIISTVISISPDTMPPAWVSDPNNILSNSTIVFINQILNTSRNFMMDCDGQELPYQIAMVIIQSMDSGWTPETFSKRLMDRWGVGYARCNNGIIGFISIAERSWYILVGSGATSQLTNSDVNAIMDNHVKSYLRESNYNDAMIIMTQNIVDTLRSPHDSSSPDNWIPLVVVFSIIIGAICILCIWWGMRDNKTNQIKNNRAVHPSLSIPPVIVIPINHEHHEHHKYDTGTSSYDFGGGDSGGSGGGGGDW